MNRLCNVRSRLQQWKAEHAAQLDDFMFSLRLFSKSPTATVGFAIVLVTVFLALFGQYVVPYDPFAFNLKEAYSPPSTAHLFGTDEMGRDTLSRVIFGTRYSLTAGLVAVSIGFFFGTFLGLVAGYCRGKLDELLMRLMDILLAFPPLVLALAITASLGPNLINASLAIGIVYIPRFARLVRSQALSVRNTLFVESAQLSGSSTLRIIRKHILPNSMAPCLIQASTSAGWAIMTMAYLSFIGIGVQPPKPEWGLMSAQGRGYLLAGEWWISMFPGLAILLVMVGFMFLGDGLRDVLDPRLRR